VCCKAQIFASTTTALSLGARPEGQQGSEGAQSSAVRAGRVMQRLGVSGRVGGLKGLAAPRASWKDRETKIEGAFSGFVRHGWRHRSGGSTQALLLSQFPNP